MWIRREHNSIKKNRRQLVRLLKYMQDQTRLQLTNRHSVHAAWRFICFLMMMILVANVTQIMWLFIIMLILLINIVCKPFIWLKKFGTRFCALMLFSIIFIIPASLFYDPHLLTYFLLRFTINYMLLITYQLTTPLSEIIHALQEIGVSNQIILTINITLMSMTNDAKELLNLLEAKQIRSLNLAHNSFKKTVETLGQLFNRINEHSQRQADGLRIRQINQRSSRLKWRYLLLPLLLWTFLIIF